MGRPEAKDELAYSPFANRHRITAKEFLTAKIDITAEVKLTDSLEEAFIKVTTKYYCASCTKQIPFSTYKKKEGLCRRCFNRDRNQIQ